ncbi:MAG: alpha/beta hydrolase [Anaerolineae bacterium]|nr:alpha/beta hydrolase [Anaerolineae bacterium]
MTLSQISPELRYVIQWMPYLPVSSRLGRWFARNAVRLLFFERAYAGVRIKKHVTSEGVRVRVYIPDGNRTGAGLLWIHGGGMVIGSAAQDDRFCVNTARELGIVVVSAEYRLAPEFPFPAPLDDCYAAWRWVQDSAAQLSIDNTRIAIGGQSAGGGLAASLAQRIHDAGGNQPLAQWLFCPMLDDRTAANRELDAIGHKVWDNLQNRSGWQSYLGTEPGAEQVPEYAVAARRRDLSGLPPAWIGTGDIELFYAEDSAYAERLSAAGVECALDVVPGAPHGFEILAGTRMAQAYLSRARDWLGQRIAASS